MRYLLLFLLPALALAQHRPPSLGWTEGAKLWINFNNGTTTTDWAQRQTCTNFGNPVWSPYFVYHGTGDDTNNVTLETAKVTIAGLSKATVSLWAYRTSSGFGQDTALYFEKTGTTANRFSIYRFSSKINAFYRDTDGGSSFRAISANDFPLNTWIHIVMTLNSDTELLALYENGVMTASNTVAKGPCPNTQPSQQMNIGSEMSGGAVRSFPGYIDEVRADHREWSPNEVLLNYAKGRQ